MIWRTLCRDGQRRDEIGFITIDEFHLLSDELRGAVLEELVVFFLHWSSANCRILGLSATVGNAEAIRDFLGDGHSQKCNIYHVTKRPKAIKEHLVVAGAAISILRNQEGLGGTVEYSERGPNILTDDDSLMLTEGEIFTNFDDRIVAKLVSRTLQRKESVLMLIYMAIQVTMWCALIASCVWVQNPI